MPFLKSGEPAAARNASQRRADLSFRRPNAPKHRTAPSAIRAAGRLPPSVTPPVPGSFCASRRRTRRSSKRVSKARRYLSFRRPNAPKHALRLPQSARQDGFLRPSRRRLPVLSAHRAAAPAAARNASQRRAEACPFAARTRQSMHCAFRNPRGRTAPSVRHAAGSRFFLRIAPPHPPQLETRLKGAPIPVLSPPERAEACTAPSAIRAAGRLPPSVTPPVPDPAPDRMCRAIRHDHRPKARIPRSPQRAFRR